jgi:hypothetical protein
VPVISSFLLPSAGLMMSVRSKSIIIQKAFWNVIAAIQFAGHLRRGGQIHFA